MTSVINSSEEPLVSICIPAYNVGKYIGDALDSVLAQSYKNIEVIVVDDGSTDNTLSILNAYIARGIKVITQHNRGQSVAANAAYRASKGAYIKFFDGDDMISRDFILRQVHKLGGRKDAIASASWGRFYNDDIDTFSLNTETVWRDMKPIDWLVESLSDGPNMMQCGLWLVPRDILQKSGLWNDKLSLINDFDFFIRVILASSEILFTGDAILYYRSGMKNALSARKSRSAYESAFMSIELGVESILEHENSCRTKKVCANSFQVWKYQFYPRQIDLYMKAEEWVRRLGGSDYPFPRGGRTKLLQSIFGWKVTKRIKGYLGVR